MCVFVYLPRWGTTSYAKLHHQRCAPGAETEMIQVLLPSVSPDVLLQPSHPHPQEREQRKFQFGVGRRRADSALFEKSLEVDSWSHHAERAVGLNQPPQGMRRASPAGCPRHAVVQQQVTAKSNSADMVRTLEKKEEGKPKKEELNHSRNLPREVLPLLTILVS